MKKGYLAMPGRYAILVSLASLLCLPCYAAKSTKKEVTFCEVNPKVPEEAEYDLRIISKITHTTTYFPGIEWPYYRHAPSLPFPTMSKERTHYDSKTILYCRWAEEDKWSPIIVGGCLVKVSPSGHMLSVYKGGYGWGAIPHLQVPVTRHGVDRLWYGMPDEPPFLSRIVSIGNPQRAT